MTRRLLPALALASGFLGSLTGADAPPKSQEYLDQYAELMAMVTSRPDGEYEVGFAPLTLDRILIKDRLGRERLYHFLAFRIRNEITEGNRDLLANATRYNEVLQQMANEYEVAKVENGVTLDVHGQKVLDRTDKRTKTLRLALSIFAYDENGSAIDLLDDPIGSGPQKALNIPDYGDYLSGSPLEKVKEKAEEIMGRRLHLPEAIAAMDLPAYDPTQMDPEGVAAGEVYGVVIFDRLNDHGDQFTLEVRGLSNKQRVRRGEVQPGQVERYPDTRILRRVWVLDYRRDGDEFYRDLDRFRLADSGWRWLDTFQRLTIRSDMAYTRFFLENLVNDKGGPNKEVTDRFWEYYRKVRETRPNAGEALPDIEKTLENR